MALYPCRECHRQVSTEAPFCPSCGVPEPTRGMAPAPVHRQPAAGPTIAPPSPLRPAPPPYPSRPVAAPGAPATKSGAGWPTLGLIGTGVVFVGIMVAGGGAKGSGSNGGIGNGFAPSGTSSDATARANDSTEAGAIRAHLASATRAELARLDGLDHKWRFAHDSATHARATAALLDSIESLLRASAPDAARAVLNDLEQPLTPAQTERRTVLEERARARADAAARAAQAASENAADAQKWSYSATTDEMTGRTSRMAMIESENTVSFGFPYEGAQHGHLVIRNHPSFGRDVILQIEQGQVLCPSYEDCTIRVRFDDGAPERWTAAGAADHSTTSVFIRASTRFVQRMRAAKVVRIAVPVYQEGQPAFEFRVGGFDNQRYTTGS